MDLAVGEIIDQLVNVELNPHIHHGRTQRRYHAARTKQGQPLTYLAAKRLIENVTDGRFAFILCGAGLSPWLEFGETDGPAGAVSIARALSVGLGALPVYIGNENHFGPMNACSRAAGIQIMDREAVEVKKVGRTATAVPFPLGLKGSGELAHQLLDDYNPAAVIAVEKLSPNHLGNFHSAQGWKVPAEGQPHVYQIAIEAQRRGIFTLGIGDGGNEIGFGLIQSEINEIFLDEFGEACFCGCGGGQATSIRADVLVSACTSNWGAYGVSACLSYLLGNPQVMQDVPMESRMIEAMTQAGAVDVVHGTAPFVDGISLQAQQALVTLLREISANGRDKDFSLIFPPEYGDLVQDQP